MHCMTHSHHEKEKREFHTKNVFNYSKQLSFVGQRSKNDLHLHTHKGKEG